MKGKKTRNRIVIKYLIIFIAGFLIILFSMSCYINKEKEISFPVQNGSRKDYDQHSFGAPRIGHKHKGVDIFAPKGTNVLSVCRGLVLYTGILKLGGNVVLILGPDFRMYYYAHLDTIMTSKFNLLNKEEVIGKVGNTGNARTTPPHLHFSISKVIPFNGKLFYDPVPVLNQILKNKKS